MPSVEEINSLPCDRDQCLSGPCCQDGIQYFTVGETTVEQAILETIRQKHQALQIKEENAR
jgi:hypothetical protein